MAAVVHCSMNIDSYLLNERALDDAYALPTCPECGEEILEENACSDCDERECDHCEEIFPTGELVSGDLEDSDFLICGDCSSDLQAKWSD